MTWCVVGAWLVALALCARWIRRITEVDELMSPKWLHDRKEHHGEKEDEHGAREEEQEQRTAGVDWDQEAEDITKAQALGRYGQADLDAFQRDVEKIQHAAIDVTRPPDSRDK